MKLFNIMVDARLQILQDGLELEGEELDELMETLFVIFYDDDAHVASRDPVFLLWAIDVLVEVFECVGLETNFKKMQAMTCTPGKI